MSLALFLCGFIVVSFLWLGLYLDHRIGEEEDWSRLSLSECVTLDGLLCVWLLLTALAGWAFWAGL